MTYLQITASTTVPLLHLDFHHGPKHSVLHFKSDQPDKWFNSINPRMREQIKASILVKDIWFFFQLDIGCFLKGST